MNFSNEQLPYWASSPEFLDAVMEFSKDESGIPWRLFSAMFVDEELLSMLYDS